MITGGNVIDCYGSTKARVADLINMKLLLNIVLSTPGAKFMTADIKNLCKDRSKRKNA